jgi:hypothetical protein
MKKIVIHEQGGHIVGWHDLHDCTCFVCRGPAEQVAPWATASQQSFPREDRWTLETLYGC